MKNGELELGKIDGRRKRRIDRADWRPAEVCYLGSIVDGAIREAVHSSATPYGALGEGNG
jgi:hypothetical protein